MSAVRDWHREHAANVAGWRAQRQALVAGLVAAAKAKPCASCSRKFPPAAMVLVLDGRRVGLKEKDYRPRATIEAEIAEATPHCLVCAALT